MSGIAVPTAILCIARRLEAIASTRQVSQTKTDIRQRAILEFAMCLGVPVIFGVLSTVYWGHRFDLYEGMGCFSAIYVSWPWVVFNLVPVLLTSVLSLAYSREYNVSTHSLTSHLTTVAFTSTRTSMVHLPQASVHSSLGELWRPAQSI